MSRVNKRKVEVEEAHTSEEEISFEKNDNGGTSAKNPKVKGEKDDEEFGRGKRPRKTYSEEQQREYEEELAEEYENLEEMDHYEVEESLKNAKTNFDAGQILEIEMKDFMCHRKFTVKLGRRLNFIVGKNGSGKSAIATALQLCLGATARNTGRGSALSTFIREGSNGPASVKVTLVNEGADAYMPEVYGNRIVIERRINKGTGAGGYHLYNAEKKEVSTKKEDLEKILRCFNIYVDNPVCCLTQEESKKFVFGKDTDKYEFFLKATGLFNLFDDLMKIKSELEETDKLKSQEESKLLLKRENIEDLQDKIEKFLKLRELEDEIIVSTAKILWDDYRTAKEKVTQKEREINQLNAEKEKFQKEIDRLSATETSSSDEIAELKEKIESTTGERNEIVDLIEAKSNDLKKLTGNYSQLQSSLNEHLSELKQHEKSVRDTTQEIESKRQQMKKSANDKSLHDKYAFVEAKANEIESLQREDTQIRDEVKQKNQFIEDKKEESSECRKDVDKLEQDIRRSTTQLKEIRSNNNRAALIADYMPQLLNQIRSSHFKETVFGPIGLAVTIKDGFQKFSKAIERVIGPALRTFVVTNMPDSNLIFKLQQGCNVRGSVPTFVQNRSNRYNVAACSPDATSFLDAITIKDDLIYNALIDQFQIDRIYLANDEEDVLRRYVTRGRDGDCLKYDAHSVVTLEGTTVRYMNGNQASEVSRYPCKNLLIGDMSSSISALEQEIQDKQHRLTIAQQLFQQFERELNESNQDINNLKQDLMAVAKRVKSLKSSKDIVQSEIDNIDEVNKFDLTPLELEKETSLKAIATIERNLDLMKGELQEKKKEMDALKKEKNTLEMNKNQFLTVLKEFEDKIEFIINSRSNLKQKLGIFQERLKEKTALIVLENDVLVVLIDELDQQKATAIKETQTLLKEEDMTKWNFNPEKLSKNDTKVILEKSIRKLKYEIAEYKKEMNLKGYTLEVLEERYNNLFEEYTVLSKTLERLQENYLLIQDNQKQRQDKWLKALKESTEITKKKFDHYVQKKGSTGGIKFNHKEKKLEISYQVDYNDKESKANDIRNLSGGERSFVTFSVLLALGHVIECPFRLMDEYDVFLDNISRRITLDQLQSYAKRADQANRQFIIITPHEVSAVHTGPSVKIIQMPEPIRASAHGLQQQTLD